MGGVFGIFKRWVKICLRDNKNWGGRLPVFKLTGPNLLLSCCHMPNPALETLMLAFTGDNAFATPPSRALFLNASPHDNLKKWPDLPGVQTHKALADWWQIEGFERIDTPEGKWPLILQLPGKSRDEVLAGFAEAWDLLEPGGMLVAAMHNLAGAGRFEKELAKAVGGVPSIQKNKCRVFGAIKDADNPAILPDSWREAGERRKIPETSFTTVAGIFSANRIDPGSQMLAEALPKSLRGSVADLGAGWGYLSDAILKNSPDLKTLDLYESDSRALDCARLNLVAHSQPVKFRWHDVAKGLPEKYDTIVMNPPFHTGKATDVELGRVFLKSASAALHTGGTLWMVANRHLPYEAVLDDCKFKWRQISCDATYKLITGTR